MVGSLGLGALVAGGDYLAGRFGTIAGDAAFTALNNIVQNPITNLEHKAPDLIANSILPSAVCAYAHDFHISVNLLKSGNVVRSPKSIHPQK